MEFNILWTVFNNGSGRVFMAGFALGSLACLICRFAVDYAHYLRKCGNQDDKALNVDAAEKGGLGVGAKIALDEDLFSLEKRAFFSQVRHGPPLQPYRSTLMKDFARGQ